MRQVIIRLKELLSTTGETPSALSEYHVLWIAFVIFITLALVILFSDASNKTTRIIITTAWAVMLIFELLKQFEYSTSVVDEQIKFAYNLGAFPYYFCSTPLYVFPLAAFMKDGHKRNTAIVFLSTFSVIGGLAIFIMPKSVLSGHVFVNFQSMLHHGIQIFMGLYLASRYRGLLTREHFLKATHAFLFMSYLAFLLNGAFVNILHVFGQSTSINLFFISPYQRYVPPLLKGMGIEKLPYPIFVAMYLFLFIALAYALMRVEKIITEKIRYDKIKDFTNI